MLLVVAGCSVRAGLVVTLGAVQLGWLFLTGFEVNQLGVLRYTGPADIARLGTLVGVALVMAVLTHRRSERGGPQ